MAYPGYGAPAPGEYPGGYPGYPQQAAMDPLYGYFVAVAGQDQQIDCKELQNCLTTSGISGTYQPFSIETCRIMITMLDRDYSGKMGFNEFKELWTALNQWKRDFSGKMGFNEFKELWTALNQWKRDYSGKMGFNEFKELWTALNQWKTSFMQYDRDRSGTMEPHELHAAVTAFGYRLSPNAIGVIVKRYAVNGRISFDDFVACCVRLRTLTDHFRRRDTAQNGFASFSYDDFVQVSMYC